MADENEVDTTTPLDGDGQNVVYPTPGDAAIFDQYADHVKPEEYETNGRTTVATPLGYAFVSADKDIPVVTHEGIKVTKEVAETLVAESDEINGRVFIVAPDDTEED